MLLKFPIWTIIYCAIAQKCWTWEFPTKNLQHGNFCFVVLHTCIHVMYTCTHKANTEYCSLVVFSKFDWESSTHEVFWTQPFWNRIIFHENFQTTVCCNVSLLNILDIVHLLALKGVQFYMYMYMYVGYALWPVRQTHSFCGQILKSLSSATA